MPLKSPKVILRINVGINYSIKCDINWYFSSLLSHFIFYMYYFFHYCSLFVDGYHSAYVDIHQPIWAKTWPPWHPLNDGPLICIRIQECFKKTRNKQVWVNRRKMLTEIIDWHAWTSSPTGLLYLGTQSYTWWVYWD